MYNKQGGTLQRNEGYQNNDDIEVLANFVSIFKTKQFIDNKHPDPSL